MSWLSKSRCHRHWAAVQRQCSQNLCSRTTWQALRLPSHLIRLNSPTSRPALSKKYHTGSTKEYGTANDGPGSTPDDGSLQRHDSRDKTPPESSLLEVSLVCSSLPVPFPLLSFLASFCLCPEVVVEHLSYWKHTPFHSTR